MAETFPPISVQRYGHHNIAPEAAAFCPKVINYSLSCVLSEHRPGLGWPLLQRSSVSSTLCQSEVHLGLDESTRGGGMDGLDESAGELQRLHLSGFGLLVPAPASS